MHTSQVRRGFRGFLTAAVVAASVVNAGCGDNSSGTAPVQTEAEVLQKQQAELAARQLAYGKSGVPTGRNPAKFARSAAAKPAAEKAP